MITRLNGTLGRLNRSAGVAAAAKWYEGAIAAYQPKRAASLAASYVNLANPGTYDAAPGVAPSFDPLTGWNFNGTNQYLKTGVIPANGIFSAIVRFSDSNDTDNRYLFGSFSGGNTRFGIGYRHPSNTSLRLWIYGSYGSAEGTSWSTSGVLGLVGKGSSFDRYVNGLLELSLTVVFSTNTHEIYIGALNSSGSPTLYGGMNMQAFGIWPYTLTAAEVADKTALIQAL
jgi:hypothetical protein